MAALRMRMEYESANGISVACWPVTGDRAGFAEYIARTLAEGLAITLNADDGRTLIVPAERVLNVTIEPA